jgi:hypothetical protein
MQQFGIGAWAHPISGSQGPSIVHASPSMQVVSG